MLTMATGNSILSIISILGTLVLKALEIFAAKGKMDDKENRINKYTSTISTGLFEDDK
jgi:hypothetical protein